MNKSIPRPMVKSSGFSYRPTKAGDLERCVELLRQGGADGAMLDPTLLALLLEDQAVLSHVFEEQVFGGTVTIRGCAFAGFMRPDIAERACRGEIPDLASTLLRAHRSPAPMLLNRAAQARCNAADQMHLAILNFAIDDAPLSPVADIQAAGNIAFMENYNGYGLSTYLTILKTDESKAATWRESMLTLGCRAAPMAAGASEEIFFLKRDMFDQHPFHPLQMLFLRRPPRLHLTPSQRDQLALALRSFTDAEIAAELGITWNTVRKRWQAIFQRVQRTLPGLLSNDASTEPEAEVASSPEKRRALLSFLRAHPEEQRPWPMQGRGRGANANTD